MITTQISLTVQALSGAVLAEIEASPSDTVLGIKARLELATKTPKKFQELLLDANILQDLKTLQSQGLDSDASLTFVRKQVGDYPLHDLMRRICTPQSSDAWLRRNDGLNQLWTGAAGEVPTVIDFILDCNQDYAKQRDWSHLTPLQLAAREGRLDIVELLLARPQFKSEGKDLSEALHQCLNAWDIQKADFGGDMMAVCTMLARLPETNINLADGDGDTALMIAVRKGAQPVLNAILCREDVNIQLQNKNGTSALHEAAAMGNQVACRKLMAKPDGAQAARLTSRGRTALDIARRKNYTAIMEILRGEPLSAPTKSDELGEASTMWELQQVFAPPDGTGEAARIGRVVAAQLRAAEMQEWNAQMQTWQHWQYGSQYGQQGWQYW